MKPSLAFTLRAMQSMFKNAPRIFSLQQQKSKQKNAAPLNPGFYLKSKIKVPSSLPIFVAAAQLTN